MNVALFSDTYPPEINGVATSTFNLRKTLLAHGENVLVVTTNPFSNKVTYEDGVLRIPGIDAKKLYNYRVSGFYSQEGMKIIERFKPDVVHCQTDAGIGIFGVITAGRFHCGMVYTFHTMIEDYAYYITHGHFDRAARHIIRFYFKGQSIRFNEFIAPSDKIKDYLRSIQIDSSISIIPTGIELDRFSPSRRNADDIAMLKAKFGIDPKDFVILSLGRIAKEKSIDVLLRGYAKFLQTPQKRNTKFLIIGWGPAEDELKDLAGHLGIEDHVVFGGACKPEETQRYYHLGDCFASASITETQGLTFMEAMAAELPVLARYDDNLVGTIKEGETGFFFNDEDDFSEKLNFLLDLPEGKKQTIISAALRAIDPYSMERFYQNVMEVYRRVWKANW